METERIVDPKDHTLKKEDMELLYTQKSNPWKYGDKHNECYDNIFREMTPLLPDNLRILELGSGEGYFSERMLKWLSLKTERFIGTDISNTASDRLFRKLTTSPVFSQQKTSIQSVGCFDFENPEDLEKNKNIISTSNLIVSMEALFLAHTPTNVLKMIDTHVTPGTFMLLADSLRIYVVREFPHRKLGYKKIHKTMSQLYKDKYDGKMRSLVAFLTQKP